MPAVHLTSAYVDGLKKRPPASGRIEVWDEKTPGLLLRVSSTGAGSWCFRYRPRAGGGFQRVTLGSIADLTLADARERAAQHRVDVRAGADPQGELKAKKIAAANTLTFDKLAQRYLEEYAKPRKASWRNDEGYLKRPCDRWRDRDAKSLTRRDVIGLLDEIKVTAPVSANRTHSVLVTLFNWAVEDELLELNPIAGLKKRAKEQEKDRTLADEELRAIWRALEDPREISRDVADALRLIVLTGQRPGEVAGMVRSELVALSKPSEARWELPAERMKNRRPHVVPICPMALETLSGALARRHEDGDGTSVFASRFTARHTLARHSLSQGLARMIQRMNGKRAGEAIQSLQAQPPTPHDLRRTLATGLARLGVPREDRLAVLAHAADDVHGKHYDRYARLREKRIALETWERHLAQVLGDESASATIVPITRNVR
jgi:integrase